MLLIKCNKGITSQDGRNICRANIIMKTDLKILNNISIMTYPYYDFKHGIDKNKLYYFPHYKDINVTITAIENSIYSFYVNYDKNKEILKIGSNYFYNLIDC